jgi:beta-lactamase class A
MARKKTSHRMTVVALFATLVTFSMVITQFFQVFKGGEDRIGPVPALVSNASTASDSLFRSNQVRSVDLKIKHDHWDSGPFNGTLFEELGSGNTLQLNPDGSLKPPFHDRLQQEISLIEANFPGSISFYLSDLSRGYAVGHLENRLMYLASGVKLLVMIEVFRQRELGTLNFNEKVFYGPNDLRDGAPDLNRRSVNQRFRIRELLAFMIENSDNAAADLLMRRVGPENIRKHLIEDGFENISHIVPLLDVRNEVYAQLDPRAANLSAKKVRSIRWSNGFQPNLRRMKFHIGPPYGDYDYRHLDQAYADYYQRGHNHLTMRTAGEILSKIIMGDMISAKASKEMLDRLVHVWSSGHRIRGALSSSTEVAHKTGTQHKRIADLSVIFLPDETPLVFTIAIAGGQRQDAERIIFLLTQRIYQYAWNYALGREIPLKHKDNLLAQVLMRCEKPQPEGYQGPQVKR